MCDTFRRQADRACTRVGNELGRTTVVRRARHECDRLATILATVCDTNRNAMECLYPVECGAFT